MATERKRSTSARARHAVICLGLGLGFLMPAWAIGTPSIHGLPPSQACTSWARINLGEYSVINNTWGRQPDEPFEQCVGIRRPALTGQDSIGSTEAGVGASFNWAWRDAIGMSVKAYPAILRGWKPGDSASTSRDLPMKAGKLAKIDAPIAYSAHVDSTGKHNVAFDLWLTSDEQPRSFGPTITHEVMIWERSRGGMVPAGQFKHHTTIDNVRYAVYAGPMASWRYIAFVPTAVIAQPENPTSDVGHTFARSFRLGSLMRHLVQTGMVPETANVSSIEFGPEVMSGTGRITIDSYRVSLAPGK